MKNKIYRLVSRLDNYNEYSLSMSEQENIDYLNRLYKCDNYVKIIADGIYELDNTVKGMFNGHEIGTFTTDAGKEYIIFSDYSCKESIRTKEDKIADHLKAEKKVQDNLDLIKSLKKNDWFYINKSGSAILYKFVEIKGNKIVGINPIENKRTNIDMNFEIGILKQIK